MTRNDSLKMVAFALGIGVFAAGPALALDRVSASEKGSLLVYPKVEIRWNAAGNVIQDTYLDLTNDYAGAVAVQLYFVNGDGPLAANGTERAHPGYNWVDNMIMLTGNEPTFWSALTGFEKGVSPFTVLDPSANPLAQGRPANDGTGERVLRGFVLAWAVNAAGEEIRWNHLKGDTLIVNYDGTAAWEHNAWAFSATEAVAHGAVTGTPGVLNLDGVEYDRCFDLLYLDFYATGSTAFSNSGRFVVVDTDLTLLLMQIDLRQDTMGPYPTKAKFDIWNQNEVKFSGTERCITFWDQELVGNYAVPNHFLRTHLQTNKGKARIDGMASSVCPLSINVPLLGVAAKMLDFDAGADFAMAGMNLVGMGYQNGCIKADVLGGPPPELPVMGATIDAVPVPSGARLGR
ncbi:MAG TPA: hypothetical protein PKK06_14720 [Phycisphaerae bacterium]|nr:hypothetical protein [Phycisphaerae bacterium]HNU46532.1 hypothetical protein [Phycisphaerae bacterium]